MQHTQHIAMVRPAAFGYNGETAINNHFQQQMADDNAVLQEQAVIQFDRLVSLLRTNGIDVLVLEDKSDPPKPDAVFPNNWFCCNNGLIQVFPLFAESRRLEKNRAMIDAIKAHAGISIVKDWGSYEKQQLFLEGTGSMVIDHSHDIAYACLSARTSESLFRQFCEENNYLPICFSAKDEQGREIYHTNVMLCIAERFSIVCLDAITTPIDLEKIRHELETTGHEIIPITFDQMNSFAGNMLELINDKEEVILLMSKRAFDVLHADQLEKIEQYARIIHADVGVIEQAAGGSVRCMVAELFY